MRKAGRTDDTVKKENSSDNTPKQDKAKKQSNLHEGHRQRMLSKYKANGFSGLEEHEILEIALYGVFTRINTNEIAHRLLNRFSTILNVFNAPISELCEVSNINEPSAVKIKFLGDLMKHVNMQTSQFVRFTSTCEFVEYGRKCVGWENHEMLLMLLLDQNNTLISIVKTEGRSDNVAANFKLILGCTNETGCKKVVLIHNHLDDHVNPSLNDIRSTRLLMDLLSRVDVTILDHIIIGTDNIYRSFHEDKIIEGI